jgi:hypothetical protein
MPARGTPLIIAAILLMQATAAPAANVPPCRILRGGIAEGMCMGTVEPDGDGAVLVSLLPAPEPGPPLPPAIAKALDRLLKAQARGALILPAKLLADGATTRFCADWTDECMQTKPLTAWPLDSYFTPGRPYLLANGSVRIEWMLGAQLNYLSLIAFEGGKIRSIDTTPATIPMQKPPQVR